jgi:hypothetical protein
MHFSQQSIYCQKAMVNLFLAIIGTTPSRLASKLSCDSKRASSTNFTLKKRKKSTEARLAKRTDGR